MELAADEIVGGNDFLLQPANTSVTGGVRFVTQPTTELEARQIFRYASLARTLRGEAVRYDLPLAPEGMTVDPHNGLLAWRPAIGQVGEQPVIVRATGADGSIAMQDFTLVVAAPNVAPVISQLPPSSGYVDVAYRYDVKAQDAEGETLTFTLIEGPSTASLHPSTGRLSWLPAASDAGANDITIRVSDASGGETTVSFAVEIAHGTPAVLPLAVQAPRAAFPVGRLTTGRISASDQLGRPVDWSLEQGPSGLSVAPDGTFQWSPSNDQLGVHPVELKATTADGDSELVLLDLRVVGSLRNSAPVIESTPGGSAVLAGTYRYDVVALDPDADPLSFALLDAPTGMSIDSRAGTIRWIPADDQLGEHDVALRVADTFGSETVQRFTVHARRAGGPPRITSVPPTEGSVGSAFLYSVIAQDAEGDPLAYRLLAAPFGMTLDPVTGELSWTPTDDQLGQQTVAIEVSDGAGGATTQSFAVLVNEGARNLPPEISSTAPRFAAAGIEYLYAVQAVDPEGTSLSYSLSRGPAGMEIDAATGELSWTPEANQAGKHVVTVRVTDEGGAAAIESFELDVLAENHDPQINSTAPADVAAGAVFQYDLLAADSDLDQLRFTLLEAPEGAEIDPFGRIRWQTSVDRIGSHGFEVLVSDPRGGEARQAFSLEVIEDLVPPRLSLIENQGEGSRNVLPWQGPFKVYVRAIDNVEVASLTLQANGQDIPLDAAGTATFTFEDWAFARIDATATAVDTNGNITQKTITFDYDFPEGWGPQNDESIPTAIISSPTDTTSVTGMVTITGTAAHENFSAYQLSYRHIDETSFTDILRSETPVENGELGVWDTSLLLNDEYVIRLEVATTEGVANVVEHNVGLGGELKLGNFRLSFTDMVIPVAGIPVEITRIYDTLQADREGDFGYGWRLEYRNTDLRVGLPKSGLEDIGIYSPLRPGVKVYLNVPGQGRQGFTFNPDIRVLPGWGGNNLVLARPRFTPDPGVTSTLSTGTSSYLQVNEQGELYAPGGIPYNPASPDFGGAYVLTTKEGTVYRIDGASGNLNTATDRSGNVVTFRDTSVDMGDRTELRINRDRHGRILRITDPAGRAFQYEYTAAGDLAAVTDRVGNTTRFTYRDTPQHILEQYLDPLERGATRYEYSDGGRLVAIVNPDGVRTELDVDTENSLQTVKDPLGNATILEFDNRGNIVLQLDPLGRETRFEYDELGYDTARIDALGNRTQYVHDSRGNLLLETDPTGATTRRVYNGTNEVLRVTNALGQTVTKAYDQAGRLISQRRFDGSIDQYAYDASGNLISETNSLGHTTTYEYDNLGNLIREIDPVGVVTAWSHDSGRRVTSVTTTQSTPLGPRLIQTQYEYDAEGRRTAVIDALGNRTQTEYDAIGYPITKIDALGHRTEYAYDTHGILTTTLWADGTSAERKTNAARQVTATTDASGATTHYLYNEAGQRVETIFPDESPENMDDNAREYQQFDAAGRLSAVTNANGATTEHEHDGNGRRTLSRDALGHATIYEYDALGRLATITDALGRKTLTEYLDGDLTKRTRLANGSEITEVFDSEGRHISTTDPLGNVTRFVYDDVDNLIRVIDTGGFITSYDYDELNNRTSQSDALGRTTHFEFDELSRQTATVLPLGQRSDADYDAAGNMISFVDFNGELTEFEYDAFGQVTKDASPDGTSQMTYTPTGLIATYQDTRGTTRYEYDVRGRLLERTEPDQQVVRYSYDAVGNSLSITALDGTTNYVYDLLNRITEVDYGAAEPTRYEYDPVGNIVLTTHPNGVVERRSYDLINQVISTEHSGPSGAIDAFFNTYNKAGQRVEVTDLAGKQTTFTYDEVYRLIEERAVQPDGAEKTVNYTYDAVGNRLSRTDSVSGRATYEYDQNDRLLSELGPDTLVTYEYDDNGNLISQSSEAGGENQYRWNTRNQLVGATLDRGGQVTELVYAYDADGNRVSKSVDGDATYFLVDTTAQYAQTIGEYATDTVGQRHIFGHGVIFTQRDQQDYYYHGDATGSTRLVTDSDGNIANRYEFDAFGSLDDGQITVEVPFLFTGEQRDAELGWDYLRARYLQYELGRFASRDPYAGMAVLPATLHPYQYAFADPVNNSDPSGAITLSEALVTTFVFATIATPLTYGGYTAYKKVEASSNDIRIALNEAILVTTALSKGKQSQFWTEVGMLATTVTAGVFSGAAGGIGHNTKPIAVLVDKPELGSWVDGAAVLRKGAVFPTKLEEAAAIVVSALTNSAGVSSYNDKGFGNKTLQHGYKQDQTPNKFGERVLNHLQKAKQGQ